MALHGSPPSALRHPQGQPRSFAKLLVVMLALVALIGVSVLFTHSRNKATALPAPDVGASRTQVELAPVTVGRMTEMLHAVGTLEANESVIIRPEIPGLIKRVLFTEGQAVEKGAVLIELDDTELQALVAQAVAELKMARLTRDRMKQLETSQNRFVSQQEIDQSISNLSTAEANHSLYLTRLAKTRIHAPFSGYVGIRRISPGDYVQAGQDLVNLEDLRKLKIDFKIPETYLNRLSIGQQVQIRSDAAPREAFTGKVYVLDPRVDSSSRSVRVRATVPNTAAKLRPGLFAEVDLVLGQNERALLIPEEAIILRRDKTFVYRVQDQTARWTEIDVGTRERGMVQVLTGLKEQDQVVKVGHHKLKDGAAVVPAREPFNVP